MELTFSTELGEYYAVEIDENMELENVMALLEAEVSSIPWIVAAHPVILASREKQLIVQSHSVTHLFSGGTRVIGRSPESQWPSKASRMKREISPIPKPP